MFIEVNIASSSSHLELEDQPILFHVSMAWESSVRPDLWDRSISRHRRRRKLAQLDTASPLPASR